MATGKEKYIFLDRDGTIIKDIPYNFRVDNIKFLPNAIKGLQKLQQLRYNLIVVSNQTGIARGLYTQEQANAFNLALLKQLKDHGIEVVKAYICPHHPDFTGYCECRKPNPGMVTLAVKEFEINPHKSIYVGDKDCDVELGKKFGGTTFLVNNGQYQTTSNPDFVVKNLLEVADILESRLNDQ